MLKKSALSNSLKKTLAITIPVVALGLVSTTIVHAGAAEKKAEATQELKSELNASGITAEQRDQLRAQLAAKGKTPEEADAEIEALLKKPEAK